jgi:hypothetical protein
MVAVAILSLALNLALTGVFILLVKRLLGSASTRVPFALDPSPGSQRAA